MQQVNAVANMWGTGEDEVDGVAASLDGVLQVDEPSAAVRTCAQHTKESDRLEGFPSTEGLRSWPCSLGLGELGPSSDQSEFFFGSSG